MSTTDAAANTPPARRKAVTIYDIAVRAGVAPSTVSRALSRPGRVSTETSDRILQVAEELGYKHARPRRSPSSVEDTYVIALVIADVSNPFFSQVMIGLQESARANGYTVLLIDSREDASEERAAIERVLHLIDGVVLSASRMSNSAIQQFNRAVPVVSLNRQVPGITSILPDSAQGMRAVVEHLAEYGHTSVTYLAGPADSWANGARWEALTQACHALGVRPRRIGPFPPTIGGGVRALDAWRRRPTTAVVGYNDVLAIGFMKSALAHGLRVPEDVSVIGIDNAGLSTLTNPGLTSLAAGSRRLGARAATAIVGHLRHRSQPQPAVTVLEMSLQERQSVGPAAVPIPTPTTLCAT
ncbi:LacI family DNA-binding transcriptional regulator [Actinomyces sp. MRS3W]|uniref:LacI family DNA-binding transcriptional regulator n=1 Tax=Actinomyces sp. MRS3W TaxID=2800796 RepID=UPI0028FD6558|nr:LacI family DNA-binding transcriptional regulator [Actinomyces sp. MRS3W]MDU0347230.1 LacI family DNA-binding transcriptional regulator [Actinomyces sp. MRS3W]